MRFELGDRARQGLNPTGRAAIDAAGFVVGGALAGIARLRGGKAVHPHGVTYGARLHIDGNAAAPAASDLLSTAGERHAIVRFSRSLGLPRPLPDLLGMSIRVPGAYGDGHHQDFLLVTSADAPILHHIFLPARDVQQRPYSSSLPYRAADRTFLIGTRPLSGSPRPGGGDEFERLARAAETGALRFELVIAAKLGRFARVGLLEITERLDDTFDALRFSPFNTGGGLEPVGVLNRLRDYAYPLSQRAWGTTGDRANEQQLADVELRALASLQAKTAATGAASPGSGTARV
jgi:hypothetical protein